MMAQKPPYKSQIGQLRNPYTVSTLIQTPLTTPGSSLLQFYHFVRIRKRIQLNMLTLYPALTAFSLLSLKNIT